MDFPKWRSHASAITSERTAKSIPRERFSDCSRGMLLRRRADRAEESGEDRTMTEEGWGSAG